MKNGQLFKLRYSYIDVCKDTTGALKCLELGGGLGQQTAFVHACELYSTFYRTSSRTEANPEAYAVHNTKLPVPHLEHPKDSAEFPLRVSFLDHQTVQTSHVVFMTQLSYKFENWQGTRSQGLPTGPPNTDEYQTALNSRNSYSAPK